MSKKKTKTATKNNTRLPPIDASKLIPVVEEIRLGLYKYVDDVVAKHKLNARDAGHVIVSVFANGLAQGLCTLNIRELALKWAETSYEEIRRAMNEKFDYREEHAGKDEYE